MIGKLIRGLFAGGGDAAPAKPASKEMPAVNHEGFVIVPEPRQINGQWQVAGRIEKPAGDETKTHIFIRADTLSSADEAASHMVRKAQMMIDQQGDGIFE
ncbi:hypothetical protein JM93_02873 [Roseibium hamelinense]|uniref:Transcriptional activator HlyU n=1 Tax=Roseibium hamelinense TaxID=150831 RepID=A0A562SXR4_9HYPH|nr:HlyU family transcriptional regulator [Roseibium hamelinense]MTI43647.1 transcriptional regulator [Roseibium hamelinense]TWI86165.1 hypothetical protein JM93_02873 [Roseibium hamelinense]